MQGPHLSWAVKETSIRHCGWVEYNKISLVNQLVALENRIDPSDLDVFLQLHPAWVATQEGSKNVHGLEMRMNNSS